MNAKKRRYKKKKKKKEKKLSVSFSQLVYRETNLYAAILVAVRLSRVLITYNQVRKKTDLA